LYKGLQLIDFGHFFMDNFLEDGLLLLEQLVPFSELSVEHLVFSIYELQLPLHRMTTRGQRFDGLLFLLNYLQVLLAPEVEFLLPQTHILLQLFDLQRELFPHQQQFGF
jgi:hypothetical protein